MDLADIQDPRRTITAREAQEQLGIPASTIRAWASQERLFAVSVGPDRQRWYLLADVLALSASTARRTRHERPTRRSLRYSDGHIA